MNVHWWISLSTLLLFYISHSLNIDSSDYSATFFLIIFLDTEHTRSTEFNMKWEINQRYGYKTTIFKQYTFKNPFT